MKKKTLLTCATGLATALMLLPATTHAQEAATDTDNNDVIVITANRAPVRLDQVGQSMTVLNERAIEASQARGVTELIAQTPGVQFSRNGGPGTTTSVYIRGADSGQTVILYDGVRLHDPSTTDGGASLTDVMSGEIGRIEILRGAQSTLYGSQAIGGVINIISREPDAPFEASAQLEAGELDSYLARAAVGGKSGGLTWRLGGGYSTSDGISAFSAGTERDGYENTSFNGRLGYAFSDDVSIDLRSYYSFGDVETDAFNGDAMNVSESKSWLNYAGFNFSLFDTLDNRLAYGRTDITRNNYDETDPSSPVETFAAVGKSDRFEYQGTLELMEGSFAVFGAEYVENEMSTSSYGAPPIVARDNTTGLYAQLTLEPLDGLTLTGGARYEDHSTFGGHTVGSASVAYTPNMGDTVLRASWAQGFKAPGLYQLYSQYGNPDVSPEEADSWDIGVEQRLFGILSLSAVYFERDTTNLINFAYCSGDAGNPLCSDGRFGFYDNVGQVDAKGVELGAGVTVGGFNASANYTYLDATNTTPGDFNEGNKLARRPQDTFNATVGYSFDFGLEASASLKVVGESFNDTGNSQLLDGYTTADFRLSYPVNDLIEIYGRVENAFDEQYETIGSYGTMPRVFYGGVRLRY